MSERSDSPSRLAQIFSKTRTREKKGRSSGSNSMVSSESDSHGLRASLEDAIEKLKSRSGVSEDNNDEPSGIKKLVPKGITSKRRRKKQEKGDELRAREEVARGRSVAERGTLGNESRCSFVSGNGDSDGDGSSLITYDSDPDSPFDTPPPLSTHPSHIRYLTTSSPLVQASIVPDVSLSSFQFDGARSSKAPQKVTALAASQSTTSLSDTLRTPANGSEKRSPSPVGRLKEALKPRRGIDSNNSPERKAGGGGVGALQEREKETGGSRRGSVVSRIFDKQGSQSESASSSPERPRTAKLQPIDTHAPPSTPPPSDNQAPIIVNTPPTPTENSLPRFANNRDRGASEPISTSSNSNVVTSPSGNMISHRRGRSGSASTTSLVPSKLSNITSAPLTPTPENGSSTPGQGGFFSSVFSAAQNAANTLSNSIANTSVAGGANRTRSGTQELKEIVEGPEVETLADEITSDTPAGAKELAVKTLGMGDLSLSALGISENNSGANTPVGSKFPEESRGRSESYPEDLSTSRAMDGGSTSGDIGDSVVAPNVEENLPFALPRSGYEPSVAGDQTPPNGSVFEGKVGIQRSGSIRSAGFSRRKRGSSAATGTTTGAAIVAANTSLSDPKSGQPKITGFAVASKKRNRDFHNLFRSVPEDDYLIEDYSCALQREILAHGRLYVSEGHLCFSSNIFGWVTTLVMSFDEIVSVEKRSTALVFKNGLMISTLHAKNIFASFTSRDSTYDLIVGIWKLGHPSLRSSLNGVSIEETGGGDKTEKYDGSAQPGSQSGSESDSEGEEGDEIYDEDEDDEDGMSFTQADGSVAESEVAEKIVSRKASAAVVTNGAPTEKSKDEAAALTSNDFPGPATHSPTSCTDQETHYPKVLADEVIQAPLGKIYSLMFGPASVTWMRNWLTGEQKCLELTMEDKSALPLGQDNKVRNYSYIKPLSGSIGPRQTKCICTETLDSMDLDKAVSVTISTQTPDVPSGNVFSVKTKYCFSWAEGNATRLQVNCAIEWTGKSWLKGPIEKGANDGQVQYSKDIVAALKAAVSSRRPTVTTTGKGKKKGRKGRENRSITKATDGAADTKPAAEDWGLFEPARPVLGPVFDIVGPLMTGNMMYGLFVGLLVASWFRFGFSGRGGSRDVGMGFLGTPDRIAAYEEIWRREESELWEWLEDRVGLDQLRDVGKMPIEAKTLEEKIRNEKMEEREVDAAIRVTEERLKLTVAIYGVIPGGSSHPLNLTQRDGTFRTYLLHIPANYNISTPVPLIFSFHGHGKTAEEQEQLSQFSNVEFNPNAFAVYPQGLKDSWQGAPYAVTGVDDISFVQEMITALSSSYCIDSTRIYAAGKSNGAGFTGTLACSPLSSKIAAFAPVSGAFYIPLPNGSSTCAPATSISIPCSPSRSPLPILEFHGSADPVIPYAGGPRQGECLPSIPHWVTSWSERDGFGKKNVSESLYGGNVTKYTFGAEKEVEHYLTENLGHAWPSTLPNDDNAAGTYYNATPIIMEFFGRWSL
ncbi:hypothetical protein G7Y89_g7490 [Cudoniella acicularis]|uniref:VASt domain-containing protein n=1 Tax=Cudoniella acicularis TaxID=354080 RepID=A0A8H4RKU4_9HELO|nr:hypothetical protein G7Y89_g7490 [Cudoniella acicularis]